jgi:hypothetical protein
VIEKSLFKILHRAILHEGWSPDQREPLLQSIINDHRRVSTMPACATRCTIGAVTAAALQGRQALSGSLTVTHGRAVMGSG